MEMVNVEQSFSSKREKYFMAAGRNIALLVSLRSDPRGDEIAELLLHVVKQYAESTDHNIHPRVAQILGRSVTN